VAERVDIGSPEGWVNAQTRSMLFGLILGAAGVSDVELDTALAEALCRMPPARAAVANISLHVLIARMPPGSAVWCGAIH